MEVAGGWLFGRNEMGQEGAWGRRKWGRAGVGRRSEAGRDIGAEGGVLGHVRTSYSQGMRAAPVDGWKRARVAI